LAAAAIIETRAFFLFVAFRLAVDAQAHAGDGLATRFGDRRVTLLAVREAFTRGKVTARTLDRVVHRRVDLFAYCVVLCPATCHDSPRRNLPRERPPACFVQHLFNIGTSSPRCFAIPTACS